MRPKSPTWSPLIVAASVAVATSMLPDGRAAAGDAGPARTAKVTILSMAGCCAAAAWPEAEAKVAVELKMLDVRVELADGVSALDQQLGNRLAAALDDREVVAALRIVRDGRGSAVVDLLYRDRKSKKAVSKHLQFEPVAGRERVPVAALKVVELLTAGALELALPRGEPPPQAAPPPLKPAPVKPSPPPDPGSRYDGESARRPLLGLALGAGAVPAPGYVSGLPTAFVALRTTVRGDWSLEGAGSLSLPGRTIPLADAKADFYHGSLRLWALWEAVEYRELVASVGGGAGAIIIDMHGHADGTRTGAGDRVLTGYAGATSRLSYAFTRLLRIGLMLNLGAALPRASVQYSPTAAMNFGWPFAEAALTVEAALR